MRDRCVLDVSNLIIIAFIIFLLLDETTNRLLVPAPWSLSQQHNGLSSDPLTKDFFLIRLSKQTGKRHNRFTLSFSLDEFHHGGQQQQLLRQSDLFVRGRQHQDQ